MLEQTKSFCDYYPSSGALDESFDIEEDGEVQDDCDPDPNLGDDDTNEASCNEDLPVERHKPRRKAKWSDESLCDSVDSVVNNDCFKSKLIFYQHKKKNMTNLL